jgi:hypothetical protein
MSNLETLAPFLAKKTRELDLGGYAEAYRGQMLTVWVNAPAILDQTILDSQTRGNYDDRRKTVALLFELPFDQVKAMDDNLMNWLYVEGTSLYLKFHEELRGKALGGSAPMPDASAPTAKALPKDA